MQFCLGNTLRCWGLSPYLVCHCPPISYVSDDVMRQFFQIPMMGVILKGYWMEVQVRAISNIVIYNTRLIMGDMTLNGILVIPCEMFCSYHLKSIRIIFLLGSSMI